jgi:serine/threonine protein kinase
MALPVATLSNDQDHSYLLGCTADDIVLDGKCGDRVEVDSKVQPLFSNTLQEHLDTYCYERTSEITLHGLNRYDIKEIIGIGGFSIVCKAYDKATQQLVAIKKSKDISDRIISKTKEEMEVQQKLSKIIPSVLGVKDCFQIAEGDSKGTYLVMDLLKCPDLYRMYIKPSVKVKNITAIDVLDLSLQMLWTIKIMEEKGILHCDLKPENIAYSEDGDLKLIDFGNKKILDDEGEFKPDGNLHQTRYFRCPAVFLGYPMSIESDLWSLGCVLFELFTKEVLFLSNNFGDEDTWDAHVDHFDLITRTLRQMPPQATISKSNKWQFLLKPTRLNADGSKEVDLRFKVDREKEPQTIRERMLRAISRRNASAKRQVTNEEKTLIRLIERLVSYDIPSIEDIMKLIVPKM